jgi:uncharacterized protein
MTISDEKYIASTTYRKSGAGVPTTTWICALDGSRVGFWTSSASGKYKRLRNNSKFPYGDVGVVITLRDPA